MNDQRTRTTSTHGLQRPPPLMTTIPHGRQRPPHRWMVITHGDGGPPAQQRPPTDECPTHRRMTETTTPLFNNDPPPRTMSTHGPQ
ncbi:hypothetical protein K443DRAFT_683725 [Laccaria amethystina LaAM-08-1]|uniref:Uncharacterized protein n=1 Tax=Laccaria amethystina LaAM-08-1 TaxID=1095629 RepID=A0A0C9XE83_9AGAR|nr:hypothetical protein K443DRAFT_683725 [Laccaria amethystina LaAM-08-1]